MSRKLSAEIRALISGGEPPYDTEKVMAWFNQMAPAMLIELEALEEEFDKLNPPDMRTEQGMENVEALGAAIRPFFEQQLAATSCITCATDRLRYLLQHAVYGPSLENERYCKKHLPSMKG